MRNFWLLVCAGCMHLPGGHVASMGAPVPLPADPPAGSCEEAAWLTVASATGSATGEMHVGDTYGNTWSRWVTLEGDGVAVSRGGAPLTFAEVDRALGSSPVLAPHRSRMARSQTVRTVMQPAPYLAVMGVGLAGVIYGVLLSDQPQLSRDIALSSLVPFTVGGVMAPLTLVIPSPRAQARHGLRDVMFLTPEDDLDGLAAEVDRANQRTRAGCR